MSPCEKNNKKNVAFMRGVDPLHSHDDRKLDIKRKLGHFPR